MYCILHIRNFKYQIWHLKQLNVQYIIEQKIAGFNYKLEN